MSLRGSDRLRLAFFRSMLSGWLSIAPGEVAIHRLIADRPAAMLMVGEPTPSLAAYAARKAAG